MKIDELEKIAFLADAARNITEPKKLQNVLAQIERLIQSANVKVHILVKQSKK